MKKILSMILSIAMVLSFGANASAATNNVESKNTEDSFIREVNGEEIDIRRSSRPDSIQDQNSIKSGRSIESPSEEAVPDSLITENKDACILSRAVKMVTGGGELSWNPSYWNDSKNIYRANCYGYMLARVSTNTWDPYCGYNFQAGYRTGNYYTAYTKSAIIKAIKSDMKKAGRTFKSSTYSEKPGKKEYKVALVIASNDYHWYRQDSDGGWSHKPGLTKITYKDASGKYIYDPKKCNRNYSYANYKTRGGYYIISK